MRAILLILLALAGLAFAPAERRLPAVSPNFGLGMTRTQVDSAIRARGLRVLADRSGGLTVASDQSGIEHEQYLFLDHPTGSSLLWRVTLAHQLPATRRQFDTLADSLRRTLGRPADDPLDAEGRPNGDRSERLAWVDGYQRVVLAGRPGLTDDELATQSDKDRTILSWTDVRLEKMVQSQRRKAEKPKH